MQAGTHQAYAQENAARKDAAARRKKVLGLATQPRAEQLEGEGRHEPRAHKARPEQDGAVARHEARRRQAKRYVGLVRARRIQWRRHEGEKRQGLQGDCHHVDCRSAAKNALEFPPNPRAARRKHNKGNAARKRRSHEQNGHERRIPQGNRRDASQQKPRVRHDRDGNHCGHNVGDVLGVLADAGCAVGRVYAEPPTLNDVFLEITGKELRD